HAGERGHGWLAMISQRDRPLPEQKRRLRQVGGQGGGRRRPSFPLEGEPAAYSYPRSNMADSSKPILAVTLGDASGTGPELITKAFRDPEVREVSRPIVIG